jgi:hypothetical protein
MAWALWLAVPVAATAVAALWAWWQGQRGRAGGSAAAGRQARRPEAAMRGHQQYLDALTRPARGQDRVEHRSADSGDVR